MYHISRHYLGQKATFTPRIPVSQNRCEIDLPARVCAAKIIEQCWEAINGCHDLIKEMKWNANGYYFFVYKFNDPSAFEENKAVKDFEATGEMVSYKSVEADLVEVFYVNSWRMTRALVEVKESATMEEAVEAYNKWQSEDLLKIEDKVKNTEWAV
jgi:hypothetical protein